MLNAEAGLTGPGGGADRDTASNKCMVMVHGHRPVIARDPHVVGQLAPDDGTDDDGALHRNVTITIKNVNEAPMHHGRPHQTAKRRRFRHLIRHWTVYSRLSAPTGPPTPKSPTAVTMMHRETTADLVADSAPTPQTSILSRMTPAGFSASSPSRRPPTTRSPSTPTWTTCTW